VVDGASTMAHEFGQDPCLVRQRVGTARVLPNSSVGCARWSCRLSPDVTQVADLSSLPLLDTDQCGQAGTGQSRLQRARPRRCDHRRTLDCRHRSKRSCRSSNAMPQSSCCRIEAVRRGCGAELSLRIVADRLAELVKCPVTFVADCVGPLPNSSPGCKPGESCCWKTPGSTPAKQATTPTLRDRLRVGRAVRQRCLWHSAPSQRVDGRSSCIPSQLRWISIVAEVYELNALIERPKVPLSSSVGGLKVATRSACSNS